MGDALVWCRLLLWPRAICLLQGMVLSLSRSWRRCRKDWRRPWPLDAGYIVCLVPFPAGRSFKMYFLLDKWTLFRHIWPPPASNEAEFANSRTWKAATFLTFAPSGVAPFAPCPKWRPKPALNNFEMISPKLKIPNLHGFLACRCFHFRQIDHYQACCTTNLTIHS